MSATVGPTLVVYARCPRCQTWVFVGDHSDDTSEHDAPTPPERLAGDVALKGCGWCGHSAGHTTDEHVARWGLPGDAL